MPKCPPLDRNTICDAFPGNNEPFHRSPDQEINDIALPQLEKLTLRHCSFKITYLPLGFTAALAEFLKDRITRGCSLDTLEITECDVTEDHIPTLEALTRAKMGRYHIQDGVRRVRGVADDG
ncbi:hypothetical protein PC9H_008800 [Pleurotus ostreatus]|uniref:Uncharacterized protein n=3 Tax=Pleurotus TaxID=5320 RepID=A0A067NVQ1_PLEO1|nr:uncharacterized protein PC9H_008800 [Pleurotus ostreatus]KAF7426432.1 hypothetical protein PC9H_008800 [Pleurotus ostreatus]KAG9221827.1 hypothetical protein CCMSSC00406_0005652 [Pleurotus cornucopiae]KDQ32153.1 hypothetical protein PLEOSDRAFT_1100666 [Pleurotus ostreatus PC15]